MFCRQEKRICRALISVINQVLYSRVKLWGSGFPAMNHGTNFLTVYFISSKKPLEDILK